MIKAIAQTFGDGSQPPQFMSKIVSCRLLPKPNGKDIPSYDEQIREIKRANQVKRRAYRNAQDAEITKRDSSLSLSPENQPETTETDKIGAEEPKEGDHKEE